MRLLAHRGREAPYYWQEGSWGNTYDIFGGDSNADGSIIIANSYYSTRRSTNYGKTFSTITPNPYYTGEGDSYTFCVRYLNGGFVNMGWNKRGFTGEGSRVWIYYSTDGSDGTWTMKTILVDDDDHWAYPYAMTYGGGYYVIAEGGNAWYCSTLAGSWTYLTYGITAYDICYGNSTFVAVGYSGGIRYNDDPSTSWTAASTPSFGTSTINGVCYGDKFVAVGAGGKIGYSSDGNTWTQATSPVSSDLQAVKYVMVDGMPRYYAVGNSGKIIYSEDGVAWSQVTDSGFGSYNIYDIALSTKMHCALGDTGKTRYALP